MARQAAEVEEQKEKLVKLDTWLETINNGLKETTVQSEILVEEEIIRYIEIYERYIREYEEYEIILKSITVISEDEPSQSLKIKLNAMQKALEETKRLVITEIERLRQVLLHLRSAPEVVEDDITQTDRTIDSTSMPEEVVSPRGVEIVKDITKRDMSAIAEISVEKESSIKVVLAEPSVDNIPTVQETNPDMQIVKETVAIETQTGKSLMSEPPSVSDKSIICQPDVIPTYDKSVTCIPPQEVEVQTSEPHSTEKEMLESIQIKQTVSDGHETIEIATRPVQREYKVDEQSLLIDADYRDDKLRKDTELNIIHSLPQSFETVMFEPDETTTEVVVDADGTKRIIVKKIRRTLVTRQQALQSQEHDSRMLSSNAPSEVFSQIALSQNLGATSSMIEDGGVQHIQYQTSQSQIVSNVPGGEVTVQEFVSKPETVITMDKDMKPEEIIQLVETGVPTQMQTTSSSVTAVVQQVTKRIIKTKRRIIRRIVIIDGKEHVTEEVVEEPDDVEVYEEQIPRVSINVKERGDVPDEENKEDKSDKHDHPALPPRKDNISKSKKPSEDTSPHLANRPDDKADNVQTQGQPANISVDSTKTHQLENLLAAFMQKKSGQSHITTSTVTRELKSRETTPVEIITESFEISPSIEPEGITYVVQEPQDAEIQLSTVSSPQVGQTIMTSQGTLHSTFETSSTNISTVVQKVVRKITKTRRRIIKHITVIDGKEHVTEEIIEEPDDVEVVEEEPQITRSTATGSVTTKRVRIIKKIEIIDGKEHVTEQIVEEPDDDVIDDQFLQHLATSGVASTDETKVEKTAVDKVVGESPYDLSTTGVTTKRIKVIKRIIIKDGQEHVTEEVIEEPDNVETIDHSSLPYVAPTDSVIRKRDKIIKYVQFIDGKEHVTEQIVEEPDDNITDLQSLTAVGVKPKRIEIVKKGQAIDGKERVIEEILEEPDEEFDPDSKITTQINLKLNQTDIHSVIDSTKSLIENEDDITSATNKRIDSKVDLQQNQEAATPLEIATESTMTLVREKCDQISASPGVNIVQITALRKVDDEPKTSVTITKTQTTILADTKENVIPTVISKDGMKDSGNPEKVLQCIQESVQSTEPEISIIKTTTVTEVIDEKPTDTVIKSEFIENSQKKAHKDTTNIDIHRSFIEKEMDHTAVSKIPISLIIEKAEVETPTIGISIHPVEKSIKTEESISTKISQTVQPSKPVRSNETLKTDGKEAREIISTAKSEKNVEEKLVHISKMPDIKDTDLTDDTKTFISSETNHTIVTKDITFSDPENAEDEVSAKTEPIVDGTSKTETKVLPPEPAISKIEVIKEDLKVDTKILGNVRDPKVSPDIRPPIEVPSPQPRDTTLVDATKFFIGSEIDHTSVSIIPTVSEKKQTKVDNFTEINLPKTVQDSVTIEPIEVTSVVDVTPTPSGNEIITNTDTVTTFASEVTKEILEIDPHHENLKAKPEVFPSVENIDISPKASQPKDTTIDDITKFFIGSEIEHTSVTKVSKLIEETLDTESEEPELVELNSTKPQQKTEKKILKEVQLMESSEAEDNVTKGVSRDKGETCKDADTSVTSFLQPTTTMSKNFVDSEIKHSMVSETPVQKEVHNIQSENIKTKQIKIIKRIEILNGKEHVTEVVVEEPDDELVPTSTITAEIDLKLSKPDLEQKFADETSKINELPEIMTIEQPKCDQVTTVSEITDGIETGSDVQLEPILDKDSYTYEAQEMVFGTPETITMEEAALSKSQPSNISIDVALEITEEKDGKLLGDENKQAEIISSTATGKLLDKTVSKNNADIQKTNVEEGTTPTTEQDFTQTPTKPTVIGAIIKEQPLSEKNETVTSDQYTVTEDFTGSMKVPIGIDSQLSKEEHRLPELVIKKQPTTEFPFLHSENIFKEPQFSVIELTKELIIQEGTHKYEQIPEQAAEYDKLDVQLVTERAPTQSPIEVVPLKIGTVITESDAEQLPKAPETSYIRQFEPQVAGSSDSVNKLLAVFNQPETQDVQSQTTKESSTSSLTKSVPEYDITMLLHSERQDTDLRNLKHDSVPTQVDKFGRTIDISMSLADHYEPKKVVPKVQFDLKVEEYEKKSKVVKKDIEVVLPSDIRITKEAPKMPVLDEPKEQVEEAPTPDLVEKQKKNKKKKKHKTELVVSEPTEIETDKSIVETDSSSLSHYVELPTSPKVQSPKPTEDILDTPIEEQTVIFKTPPLETPEKLSPKPKHERSVSEFKSSESPLQEPVVEVKEDIVDSYKDSKDVSVSEEQGYEPEDLSIGGVPTPDKRKKPKKRRQQGTSEDTVYPKLTSTETEDTTVTTPIEMLEPVKKVKEKRRKKKTVIEPTFEHVEKEVLDLKLPDEPKSLEAVIKPFIEEKSESPKIGTELVLSPKEESYRTMSETSDISTVKIVEECVQSSPEVAEKEVPTTVTFPVPVIEEIATQEYSIQTSPEESEIVRTLTPPETSDIELQTTPTSISEVITQTTPVEDKEAHTQTFEEIKTVVEKIVSDTEIQTSRSESPVKIIQSEATTQVIPQDIVTPSEKFSQTSPVQSDVIEKPLSPEIEKESREIQTSPEPEVETEEKSTEIFVQTTESDIQTVKQDIADQGTSTSPIKEKELTEISIQTPEVPLVSSFTQSDTPEPVEKLTEKIKEAEKHSLPSLETVKHEIITVDSIQQTTPREEEVRSNLEIREVITADSSQQTTPREIEAPKVQTPQLDKSPSPESKSESPKNLVLTVDNTQQTSPRPEPILETTPFVVPILDLQRKETITIDSIQQTTPRIYSDDSVSTSTSEPYEIHLKAQVTIPQATTDFLEYERQFEEPPMSAQVDKHKPKKRRSKKKADSPLVQSPESLSDLINTELSMSITPTSEDVSLKDSTSIDEGISQYTSPVMPTTTITHPKLTYSDVVQRSKSKSPSPSKTIVPHKSEKARLIDALEKRARSVTQPQRTVPDDYLTIDLLEPSVQNSYQLVVNKELDEVKNAIENNDPSRTERSIIIIIETISIWLEEIQYKIQRQTLTGVKTTKDNERLKELQNNVLRLKNVIEVTEVNEEIITLIETLTRQVNAVSTLSNQSSIKVQEYEKEWIKFLDDIDHLNVSVEAVKETLDNVILSEIPTQQKLEKLDKIESTNFDNVASIRKMYKRCRSLIENNPKRECPSKLYDCDDDSKQVENAINTERDRLLQLASLAEEYEQTLQDFGQITDVAEALLDGKIIVSDLDHLHEEIQKHRKFFVNLSHCRAILESLEDNLDNETRAKYSSLHNLLHDRATVIIDRAASRAQQMTLAASRWSLLQHGMKEEMQWLVVAQQRVPDLSNVTSLDHEQYINLYQSISLDLSHHYAKMLRLLSITQSLQNLIVCSDLETECSVALDTLLKLQDDVDSRLTRLTAFKENWVTYDYLIDRIEGWMKVANRELEFITPDNITTTGNLRRFWELKAQHEVHNNLKNESAVQFEKALEILPVSDEMVQRQFFSKIEDKWSDLASKISNIHSTAIQNISDRDVSSGEKLNILEEELRELRSAVEGLKGVIKSEDELNLYIERLQVMTSRIDRIQNELGRLSLLPTAEAERLGALLTQSGNLGDQIAEELERSMLLKEKIVQVQAGIARCQKSQRRARLTLEECEAAERLGSDVVERASENCDKLIDELGLQWRDILALRQALHSLPISLRVVVSPTGVEKDISGLQVSYIILFKVYINFL